MPIIFKLIGNIKLKVLEIKYDINGIVRLSSIISIFKNYGIPPENFEHIKFIVETEHLNNNSKFFKVSDNYNLDPRDIQVADSISKEFHANLIIADVSEPLEVCLTRDLERNIGRVGRDFIIKLYNKYYINGKLEG
jgi:hypothetical protein